MYYLRQVVLTCCVLDSMCLSAGRALSCACGCVCVCVFPGRKHRGTSPRVHGSASSAVSRSTRLSPTLRATCTAGHPQVESSAGGRAVTIGLCAVKEAASPVLRARRRGAACLQTALRGSELFSPDGKRGAMKSDIPRFDESTVVSSRDIFLEDAAESARITTRPAN